MHTVSTNQIADILHFNDKTYYEQYIYENINNFAAFIKIISVHSVTYVIIKTLTDLTPIYYQH